MKSPCPKCSADTSQSSGIVCPACGCILQPESDETSHPVQLVPERRWLRVALAFALPFLFIAGGVGITAGSLSLGALCGGVVGGLFVVSFAIASTGRSNPLGRWFGALLLFFGFAAVLCGLAYFGCRVIGF